MGVTIVGLLTAAGAFFMTLAGLVLLAFSAAIGQLGGMGGFFSIFGAAAGTFVLVFAALYAVIAVGLFAGRSWGWYLTLLGAGLGMLGGVVSLLAMDVVSAAVNMGISGLIAWYFFSPPVQAWFGVSHNVPWTYANA